MAQMFTTFLAFVSALVADASAEKHLIIVSLPADAYYKDYVGDIAKFANDLAGKSNSNSLSLTVHTSPVKGIEQNGKHLISIQNTNNNQLL